MPSLGLGLGLHKNRFLSGLGIPTDQLLHAYYFEESAGSPAKDEVGNLDLTDNNTVGRTTGRVKQGASFDPNNNEYFSIADDTDYQLIGDRTFVCWFFGSLSGALFSKLNGGLEYQADGIPRFLVYANGVPITVNSNSAGNSNQWNLWICGYDSNSGEIFVEVNRGTENRVSVGAPDVKNSEFQLSRSGAGNAKLSKNDKDIFLVYGKVLTSSERNQIWNNGNGIQ